MKLYVPKFNQVFFRLLLLMGLSIFFISCVGTVKETKNRTTKQQKPEGDGFPYPGIISAKAIAEDKIEIEFEEVYDSTTHDYLLYVNEGDPIKLSLESLAQGKVGYKKFTLQEGLEPNQKYNLRIAVRKNNGAESKGENEVTITTFDNEVAEFGGISAVEPIVGNSHTSVKVSWVPSEMKGQYDTAPYDTKYYEITYIPKTSGLSNINKEGTSGRTVIRVSASPSNNPNSYEGITNLDPNTSYYFQVRAIHTLYVDHEVLNATKGTPIGVNRELNTTWIEYKTTDDQGIYDFNVDSVVVKNAPGSLGLNSVDIFWKAPEGIFDSYKVFYRRYIVGTDGADATLDDKLTTTRVQDYINGNIPADAADGGYKNVTVTEEYVRLTGLKKYEWYQIKVVPCKTSICLVDPPTDKNASAMSNLKAIRIEPQLATFTGIVSIDDPSDPDDVDKIQINFETPSLSEGHATKMLVYCLDPTNYASYTEVPLQTDGSATGGVANCDGLSYSSAINVATSTSVEIGPVNNIKTSALEDATYCFAMTPAITGGDLENKQIPPSQWIVRCIEPDVPLPTSTEFTGVEDSACHVNQDSVTINWPTPSGGIYSDYRIFSFQKDAATAKFNFAKSIEKVGTGDTDYVAVTVDRSINTYNFTDLTPGATYFIGVLAIIDNGDPTLDLYSEYNINIAECKIPYPKATFNEWTRIFALGPRIDGRVPIDSSSREFHENAYIYEAINKFGIPYEVEMSGDYVTGFTAPNPNAAPNYQVSPGSYDTEPASFSAAFDGRTNSSGYSISNSGIISLAWEDITLNFNQTEFDTAQASLDDARGTRTFGYRVYRSVDNKQTWEDLSTDANGLIYAANYSYYPRANATQITERMAFFTDYSVASLTNDYDSTERARVYWYKVVPVYNGEELKFIDEGKADQHSIIKVTLPPPNMALVHRQMANRNLCLEMNKSIDTDNHYSCDFNGLGSRPKDTPWMTGQGIVDLGGDLLVDRHELGCNITRGHYQSDQPFETNSFYYRPDTYSGFESSLVDFTGYATTSAGVDDTGAVFKGCTNGNMYDGSNDYFTLDSNVFYSGPTDFDNDIGNSGVGYLEREFDKLLYGDCIYDNALELALNTCADADSAARRRFNYPGLADQQGVIDNFVGADYNCANTTNANEPQSAYGDGTNGGLLTEDFIYHHTIQAEHLAVLYNRNHQRTRVVAPYGPGSTKTIDETTTGANEYVQTCFVNIAAIGQERGGGNEPLWFSRWYPANFLNQIKSDDASVEHYYDRKISDIHSETALYQTDSNQDYRRPTSTFTSSNDGRYTDDTKLGRILSSNSSKLPPLVGFSRTNAQRLCETYEVEVGFSEDGSQFSSLEPAKNKRLMRRSEFVIAAAHSEKIAEGDDTNADDDYVIWNIEDGSYTGSCVSNNNYAVRTALGFFGNRSLSEDLGPSNRTEGFLWTGSSSRTSNSRHSEDCVSRYGIQDLVGNVADFSIETLSCDYRLDGLFFGQDSVQTQSVILDGYRDTESYSSYSRLIDYGSAQYIWNNARIIASGPNGTFENGGGDDVVMNNPVIWLKNNPDSGYCSLVDNNSTRATNPSFFADYSGIFNETLNFIGALNTTMVTKAQDFDQEAVDYARNGDGFFMNFGPTNILPEMGGADDSLALTSRGIASFDSTVNRVGKFFNTVLGLPLACSYSGRDTCEPTESGDNRTITTAELKDNTVTSYLIDDFPIGHSQVKQNGIGTITEIVDEFVTQTEGQNNSETTVITEIQVDAVDLSSGVDQANATIVEKTLSQLATDEGDVYLDRGRFNIPRGSVLQLENGGSFADDLSGRYGLQIRSEGSTLDDHWDSTRGDRGIRCVVKVNEN